jgi:hypothetical protein
MDTSSFSSDYAEARDKFLTAASALGAVLAHYANPNRGPGGETLATDVAWLGPSDAPKAAVLISGTHGVEGFCGSGAQVAWMRSAAARRLPAGVAVLLVHAINPYGFAWLRRVTEEGVDLNRNYVDFDRPLPENRGYDELAADFLPEEIEGPAFEAAMARIEAWRATHGDAAYFAAYSAGQYRHPLGFFYGGAAPTWSRRTTESICARFLADRRQVAGIDFHTGLGPHGYGEPICHHEPDTPALARARAWYGDSLTEPRRGTSTSQARSGLTHFGYARALPGVELNFVTLEYGTYARERGTVVFREDHWLHRKYGDGAFEAPRGRAIKAAIRKHFYPDTQDWKEMVLWRAFQVIRQTVEGLGSSQAQRREGIGP